MVETNLPRFSFLAKLINGGIAGIFGITCVFPLDLVKTRLQNQPVGPHGEKLLYSSIIDAFKKTYRADGFFGLYRGSGVTIIVIIPEKATVLAANDFFRYHLRTKERKLPIYRQVLAGGMAGLCQIVLTTPTELLKIRMQDSGRGRSPDWSAGKATQRRSARDLAMEVIRQNGIFGLYKGVLPTMLRDVTFSMIFFPLFATINSQGPKKITKSDETVFWWSFISGYIGGSFSALIVTPFDVVKTRIQAQSTSKPFYTGVGQAFLHIIRIEGPRALFKGGACRMLVIAPGFGITQAVYYVGIGEYLLGIKK